MDKKSLIGKLNEITRNGCKKKDIENSINMPQNTLAGYLSGNKELPDKWIEPISEYLEKNFPNEKSGLSTVQTQPEKKLGKSLEEKKKTLSGVIGQLHKDFGEGCVFYLGEKPKYVDGVISTGSMGIDNALGIGGLLKGRIVEIYGPESSGKTTLATHVIAEAQKKGGVCAMIDAEHAFDPVYAQKLGVDIDNMIISQPDYGEQALEIANKLVESGQVDVIVIDSVAALVPKSELEGEMGDQKMGLQARLMSQAMRKMCANVAKTNTLCIFINQLRDKIGVMFGSPETTTGGNALKFFSSIRIDIRRIGQLKDGDSVIGNRVRVKIAKNKVAPPFKTTELDIVYGEGFDKYGELLDIATATGVIQKSGSWYSYNSDKIGQGKQQASALLRDNQDFFEEIKSKILA